MPKRKLLLIVGLVVAVAAAGVAALLLLRGGSTEAGECVSVTGAEENASVSSASCEDKSANFVVATRGGDDCPAGALRQVRDGDVNLCLQPNFREGNCYSADDANGGFRLADCAEPEVIKITKKVSGTADSSECPDGQALPFTDPEVVYCIEVQA